MSRRPATVLETLGASIVPRLNTRLIGLKIGAIRGQHEFRLGLGGSGTGLELRQGIRDLAFRAHLQMDEGWSEARRPGRTC